MIDPRPIASSDHQRAEPERTVRRVLEELERLDPATARYLDGLAFILTRVADADDDICSEETRQIEHILRESSTLPREQAVLVAEIAKHRTRLADCACAYRVSREFRLEENPEDRARLLRFLFEVARADGQVSGCEQEAILQIASEIGISQQDVVDLQEGLGNGHA